MKRDFSDMESECEEVFGEDATKGTPTQSTESYQLLNKKRRRGGSAKLEKAEILQMTVDHLKMLHAKGFDAFSFDPHKYAADYHSLGFRECATEVARYLVAIEGLDLQDPLRLRLMSHLQCYSAQRELVMKPSGSHNPWNPSASFGSVPPPTPQHPPPPVAPPSASSSNISAMDSSNVSYSNMDARFNHTYSSDTSALSLGAHSTPHMPRVPPNHAPCLSSSAISPSINPNSSSMVPTLGQMQVNQYLGSYGLSSTNHGPPGGPQSTSVKPYRPWGSEFAY
ncbi:hairy/enhancer-of-split related with YRPW motif protein-like isoform X2 [Tachypleus tridentatus]|uniref:hairy/enhancer-of-split related with YRPW motif protein-like isoform X2 n=1 Tax=Tachypleus tridentatus TaxID=6853 RepID=UPI003FD23730